MCAVMLNMLTNIVMLLVQRPMAALHTTKVNSLLLGSIPLEPDGASGVARPRPEALISSKRLPGFLCNEYRRQTHRGRWCGSGPGVPPLLHTASSAVRALLSMPPCWRCSLMMVL